MFQQIRSSKNTYVSATETNRINKDKHGHVNNFALSGIVLYMNKMLCMRMILLRYTSESNLKILQEILRGTSSTKFLPKWPVTEKDQQLGKFLRTSGKGT